MSRMKNKERRSLFMRVGAVLIVVCMIAALALPALAADTAADEPYSYTVRVFPGDKGTVDGKKDPIVKVVEPGYKWTGSDFDYGSRAASDTDKYYVRGIREAGRDNNTTNNDLIYPSFTVNRDIDLVVAYGIKGSDVAYTIHYVELETNKELLKPRTYHGNVGDKPAVAYLYVEDYVPQYENITGTLDADADKNDWTFYYVKIDDKSVESQSKDKGSVTTQSKSSSSNGSGTSTGSSATSTGTSTGRSTSTASSASNGSGSSTASGTSNGTSTSPAGGTSTATNTTNSGATAGSGSSGSSLSVGEGTMLASNGAVNTRQNGPVEIVDVDETETPLVEYDSVDESAVEENADELINRETEGVVRAKGMSGTAKMILGVVIVMAVAAAGWFFFRRLNTVDDE